MSEKLNDDEYTRETESTCYCYNTESSCNETTVSFLSSITDKVLAPLRRVYSSKTGNCSKQQNQNEPTRNKWLIRRLTDGNTFSKWITTEARCKETRFAINSRMGTRFLDQIFILAKEEAEGGQSRVHSGIVSRWTHRNTGVTRWGRKKRKAKEKKKRKGKKGGSFGVERNSALSYSQFDERIPVSRQNFIYSGKFSNIEMNSLNTSATAEICDRRWINLATKMEGKRKGRLSSGRLVVIRRITEQLCSLAKLFPRSSNRSHGTSPLSLSLSLPLPLSLSLNVQIFLPLWNIPEEILGIFKFFVQIDRIFERCVFRIFHVFPGEKICRFFLGKIPASQKNIFVSRKIAVASLAFVFCFFLFFFFFNNRTSIRTS